MMPRRLLIVPVLALWSGCDCGGKIAIDHDAAPTVDGPACASCGDPNPPAVSKLCTDDEKKNCQKWAESLVCSGYAHGACVQGQNNCVRGDQRYCNTNPPGICHCYTSTGLRSCDIGEVCVSDTPDGPERCVKACSQ